MNMFEKLNKNTRLFDVDIENPVFKKLKDFEENQILRVDGMYTNKKSKFGEEPIFIVFDGEQYFFVHVPKSHLETIKTIIETPEMVKGVNDGECYIKVTSYYSKRFSKQCFDVEFTSKPSHLKPPKNDGGWTPSEMGTQEDIF